MFHDLGSRVVDLEFSHKEYVNINEIIKYK